MDKLKMKPIAKALQDAGRGGDTMLAHITPHEGIILKAMGGSGTTNPETGLPEFGWFSDIFKIAAVVALVVFAPEIAAAGAAEAGVTGAGLSWSAEVAAAAGVDAAGVAAGTTALGAAAEAQMATYLLDGGAEFIAAGMEGTVPDIAEFVNSQAMNLTGEGVVQGAGEVAQVAGTEAATQLAPELGREAVQTVAQSAPQAGSTAFGDAVSKAATLPWNVPASGITAGVNTAVAQVPWYQTILDTIAAHPTAAAITAQGVLGGVGAMGAASAKEKEVELAARMPSIQQQAAADSMAGAGQSPHVLPTGNLMPPEWNQAGVVPRDPITGLPLGPNYPVAGLINRRT